MLCMSSPAGGLQPTSSQAFPRIVSAIRLGITILVAHSLGGMFGVALGALGTLGTFTMALAIDAYGPISDSAGGIAVMSGLPSSVRGLEDCLDAAGNTTAAIGKGLAIGSSRPAHKPSRETS